MVVILREKLRYNLCNDMDDGTLDNNEMLETTESFEEAYQAHAGSIYRFLFWRTNDAHLSEDLTSTTFQKAWMARKNFRKGSVRSWLYRIAHNVLIDYWRKNKEISTDLMDVREDGLPSTEEVLDRQMQLDRLQKALDKLPPAMSSVITLRFIERLPCKVVSQRLGMNEGNVRIIQYRALKKLRGYLK